MSDEEQGPDRGEDREAGSEDGVTEIRDLGFGSRVADQTRTRLMNHDGSFNVERRGLPRFASVSVYGFLHRIPWWQFYLLLAAAYLAANLLFAGAYLAAGPGAIEGLEAGSAWGRYWEAFFFSVQTMTTVGYGALLPGNAVADALVTLEALLGLGGFAVVAAVVFARLARPQARIGFSDRAVVAPYGEGRGFELRAVNRRRDELVQARAEVVYAHLERRDGSVTRTFHRLDLERDQIAFFPLHWTVVHPVGPDSPLHGKTRADLEAEDGEFLVQVTAVDEAHYDDVVARTSYKPDEVRWGARFRDIFERSDEGVLGIDVNRIHETEPVDATAGAEAAE
ncbi:MAG: ion channel [Gemmatimonadota bacterium]